MLHLAEAVSDVTPDHPSGTNVMTFCICWYRKMLGAASEEVWQQTTNRHMSRSFEAYHFFVDGWVQICYFQRTGHTGMSHQS